MLASKGYAVHNATDALAPFSFERRELRPNDVQIDIKFCGICHSDIHQARGEWGNSLYPMVPGHEIVGVVAAVGSNVTKFKAGDLAGVGCMVDSCRECATCKAGEEIYCERGQVVATYNGKDKNGELTFGGYSNNIVVDETFTLKISPKLDLAATAPLLCAGITTYSPPPSMCRHRGSRSFAPVRASLEGFPVSYGRAAAAISTMIDCRPTTLRSPAESAHSRDGLHVLGLVHPARLREHEARKTQLDRKTAF